MVVYKCKRCKKIFEDKTSYERHLNKKFKCKVNKSGSKVNKKKTHCCKTCKKTYTRKTSLVRHMKTQLHKANLKKLKITKIKKNNKKNMDVDVNANGNSNEINNCSKNNSYNKINSDNTIINNNNYYLAPFGEIETDKLTTDDKLNILLSDEDPIVQIIFKTNLNKDTPEYHNVGYMDIKSGYGYIFCGDTWEKKEIRLIMNDLINFKGRDIKKIYKEMSKYMTEDNNKIATSKLLSIDNLSAPKSERDYRIKRKLEAHMKGHFFNGREFADSAIEKSEKPIRTSEKKDQVQSTFALKNDMTIEALTRTLEEQKKIVNPKKEIAKYIIGLLKNTEYEKRQPEMMDLIDSIAEEQEINVAMRLLCQAYCHENNINDNIIQQKLNDDKHAKKIIKDNE